MLVVGMWIWAFLSWLWPTRGYAPVRPRTLTPVRKFTWPIGLNLPLHRLAPIHPPTHRRRL
jgi:hypothetical protein